MVGGMRVSLCVSLFVCVCVRARERERERKKETTALRKALPRMDLGYTFIDDVNTR